LLLFLGASVLTPLSITVGLPDLNGYIKCKKDFSGKKKKYMPYIFNTRRFFNTRDITLKFFLMIRALVSDISKLSSQHL
jgi:hypothetical protein